MVRQEYESSTNNHVRTSYELLEKNRIQRQNLAQLGIFMTENTSNLPAKNTQSEKVTEEDHSEDVKNEAAFVLGALSAAYLSVANPIIAAVEIAPALEKPPFKN